MGRAIALRFAEDGCAVALAGRSEPHLRQVEEAITSRGGQGFVIGCDVTVRDAVRGAVAATERTLGPIDVLVNNAGIAGSAPFTSMSDELWDRVLSVNLTGTYNCMRAVVPGMFGRRVGRVINIASTAAKVGFAYTSAYVASKHGVLGLTRAVALEAQSRGVTVNAICPGWLNTDMTQASIARIVEKTGRTAAAAQRMLEQMNRQQRLIEPDEVAAVAAYLASPEAADVNGEGIDL